MTNMERWRLGPQDASYPEALRRSPRPPRVLHGMGDTTLLAGPGLAIVGSRKATPYGLQCAKRFARIAVGAGLVVVSGAAIGCDLAALQSAIDAGGKGIAVLGCGPDIDYPRRAAHLLSTLRTQGAVVAEADFGVPPLRWAFPERNRIIAALSCAVLVVEAALPSGTFSTADHALAAGRDVAAVPGSIFSPTSAGTNRLLRDGAIPITCDEDMVDMLAGWSASSDVSASSLSPASERRGRGAPHLSMCDPLSPEAHRAITAHPLRPEGLASFLGIPLTRALRILGELETCGLTSQGADGSYAAT